MMYTATKNNCSRSFDRVKTKVVFKYVMQAQQFCSDFLMSFSSVPVAFALKDRQMYTYMHGTGENQVAYHFCFQHKSGVNL